MFGSELGGRTWRASHGTCGLFLLLILAETVGNRRVGGSSNEDPRRERRRARKLDGPHPVLAQFTDRRVRRGLTADEELLLDIALLVEDVRWGRVGRHTIAISAGDRPRDSRRGDRNTARRDRRRGRGKGGGCRLHDAGRGRSRSRGARTRGLDDGRGRRRFDLWVARRGTTIVRTTRHGESHDQHVCRPSQRHLRHQTLGPRPPGSQAALEGTSLAMGNRSATLARSRRALVTTLIGPGGACINQRS